VVEVVEVGARQVVQYEFMPPDVENFERFPFPPDPKIKLARKKPFLTRLLRETIFSRPSELKKSLTVLG
jgi:hypothetical protein